MPLNVFHCVWDDKARKAAGLPGTSNAGQQTLQIAIWGMNNHRSAEAAPQRQLEKMVVVEKAEKLKS